MLRLHSGRIVDLLIKFRCSLVAQSLIEQTNEVQQNLKLLLREEWLISIQILDKNLMFRYYLVDPSQ